ncbi:MAG: hypothetical protein J6U91_07075 [Alistipes sp.]|nr:hypothetical protein [Alistipes sp.]
MRNTLILILLTLVGTLSLSAQTYYYEREAVVTNNVKRSASGDGHFITFTSKACYDSDIEGYSEEFGTLMYEGVTSNNLHCYSGKSYFGTAYYYFSSDRSRLNIKKQNGEILVYVRKTPPRGVTRSSRPRPEPQPPVVNPTPPDTGTLPINNKVTTKSEDSEGRTCKGCNGTGLCTMCKGLGYYKNKYDGNIYECDACHNGKCGVCNGKGKIKGYF